MIHILLESGYSKSVWGSSLYSGLTYALKKRRKNYQVGQDECVALPGDTVYVIGTSPYWLNDTVNECNKKRIVPILLGNQTSHRINGLYHMVQTDLKDSVRYILSQFDKDTIALYGVNPASITDAYVQECFQAGGMPKENIFYNIGSLETCFDEWLPSAERFDVVLCCNDFAAISLYKTLETERQELLNRVRIICYAETLLLDYYRSYIDSIDMNLRSFGESAVCIAGIVENNTEVSNIVTKIKWSFNKKTVQEIVVMDAQEVNEKTENFFYEDIQVEKMMQAERLIRQFDEIDREIIRLLIENMPSSQIAEECFITEGTVKYRVKKMLEMCNMGSRKELAEFMSEYI